MRRVRHDRERLPCDAESENGKVLPEIMTTAADEKVSIMILDSHGRSNITEKLMGSVSENVISHAKVPSLVISREIRQGI
jgi:nucleotide-binding universal stress UspA family protein